MDAQGRNRPCFLYWSCRLGGSSSINGMVYVRGNRADFDAWATMGATGWSYADVLPYFKRAENWALGPDPYRGGDGPLQVRPGDNQSGTPLHEAFIEAGIQAGYGTTADYNGRQQEGFARFAMTVFHSGPNRGASYLSQSDHWRRGPYPAAGSRTAPQKNGYAKPHDRGCASYGLRRHSPART